MPPFLSFLSLCTFSLSAYRMIQWPFTSMDVCSKIFTILADCTAQCAPCDWCRSHQQQSRHYCHLKHLLHPHLHTHSLTVSHTLSLCRFFTRLVLFFFPSLSFLAFRLTGLMSECVLLDKSCYFNLSSNKEECLSHVDNIFLRFIH